MRIAVWVLSAAAVVGLMGACGDKDKKPKKGMSITVPEVEPKVRSATPTGLLPESTLRITSETTTNPATEIKSRLFSGTGPTDIFTLLAQTDSAMAAIQKRTEGQHVPCLADYESEESETLVDKEPVAFPNVINLDADGTKTLDLSFTQHLHCIDVMDANSWRAFGKKTVGSETTWSIRDGSKLGGFVDPRAVKVSATTDEAEVWFRVGSPEASGSGVLAHLKRNTDDTFEYTHTGKGVGYGCGLHLLAKDNLMLVKVKTDQATNGQGDIACADFTGDTDKEYCIDGSDTTFTVKDAADCTAAGLTTANFTLTSLDYTVATYSEAVWAFAEDAPTTIATFEASAPPEVEEE